MNKKMLYIILGVVALVVVGGYLYMKFMGGKALPNATQIPPNTVIMKSFSFTPDKLEVAVGTTVTWENQDSFAHDVKSDQFVSPKLRKGEKFTYTYTKVGEYSYICGIHPTMTGKIIVK